MILVITNQAGIGRGYFNEVDFHFFMKWMNDKLDNLIDDYFFCPYHETYGIGKYKKKSNDRKPNPGMINKAIQNHFIEPKKSIFIGDKITDMIAASSANISCKLLLGNYVKSSVQYETVKSLKQVQNYLKY